MNTIEYKKGYAAGTQDAPGFSFDGQSPEFVAGYCQALRDAENMLGNPDVDSFDF